MTPSENRLLAQLPVHERNAVFRGSQSVTCAAGDLLLNAKTRSDYVFFPVDMVVSIVRTLLDGKSMDIGVVGSEGMIGLDVFIDASAQHDDAVVQCEGTAWCMPADDLRKQFHGRGLLQKHLLRFTNAFLSQVSQTAVCSRFHPLESRLSRWLMMIHDRSPFPKISNTPDSIARALGVEAREVDAALTHLATARAIRQHRHAISVADPERLELTACECYDAIRQAYDRIRAA